MPEISGSKRGGHDFRAPGNAFSRGKTPVEIASKRDQKMTACLGYFAAYLGKSSIFGRRTFRRGIAHKIEHVDRIPPVRRFALTFTSFIIFLPLNTANGPAAAAFRVFLPPNPQRRTATKPS